MTTLIEMDKAANVCVSGGAPGADLEWGMVAAKRGHGVVHFSFQGHKSPANTSQIRVLSDADLAAADPYMHRANLTLRRKFPAKSLYVTNMLRRDWYQARSSTSCYGVSTFKLGHSERIAAGEIIQAQVDGGTAWCVQCFIDQHDGAACPCYVFDQLSGYWFKWEGSGWMRINEPPRPVGVWAGVGKRDLLTLGRLAIRVLMDYRQDYHSPQYPPY